MSDQRAEYRVPIRQHAGEEPPVEVLKAENLVKHFDKVTAMDGVSFSFCRGEIFGFMGPNGAGKTTTINLLTGLARSTSGSMHLEGMECEGLVERKWTVDEYTYSVRRQGSLPRMFSASVLRIAAFGNASSVLHRRG